MAIIINDNLSPLAPKILDNRYGPYSSITQANLAIDVAFRVVGLTVGVLSGSTTFSGGRYISSSSGVIEYWYYTGIDDSDLVLKSSSEFPPTPAPSSGFVDKEILSPVDGKNTVFNLAYTPELGSVSVYYNGLLQDEGINDDYTISGKTIAFNSPPLNGSRLISSYRTYSDINFMDNEVPSGAIDGVNTVFSLIFTPKTNSEHLYLNGLLMESGVLNDYTISGDTITFNYPPMLGSSILCSYRYN